nr:uncharacterized protein LOC128672221 [Plodia interpunctella]
MTFKDNSIFLIITEHITDLLILTVIDVKAKYNHGNNQLGPESESVTMKLLLLTYVLFLSRCESRIASAEIDIEGEEDKAKTNFECTLRSLKAGDPYPSVVVKWHGQIQRFTWNQAGEVIFEKDYKHAMVPASYPSSSGLSGGSPAVNPDNADYFKDVPVVPKEYSFEDITTWFSEKCVKPY